MHRRRHRRFVTVFALAPPLSPRLLQEHVEASSRKWTIRPGSSFKASWDWVIVTLVVYNAIMVPVQIAFAPEWASTTTFSWFDIIVDTLFSVDIIINMNTGFTDKWGTFVSSRGCVQCPRPAASSSAMPVSAFHRLTRPASSGAASPAMLPPCSIILRRYLKGMLIVDILAVLPFQLVAQGQNLTFVSTYTCNAWAATG